MLAGAVKVRGWQTAGVQNVANLLSIKVCRQQYQRGCESIWHARQRRHILLRCAAKRCVRKVEVKADSGSRADLRGPNPASGQSALARGHLNLHSFARRSLDLAVSSLSYPLALRGRGSCFGYGRCAQWTLRWLY